MKKLFVLIIVAFACAGAAKAQKFAFIDQDYILKKIPNYEMANEQINQISQRWQREVETLEKEAATLNKNYQSDMVFLTDEQKKKKEAEITAKEKEAAQLKYKYFGPNGELFKKQESLIKPIQDDIYNACKKVADERGYQVIFDRASQAGAIFVSPRIDVTEEVLNKMGY
ncbi:MAG: OmpH family outer membrane protein [Muribaculaceae bacterium]|nr:OmpH family outer membrane protein [Muribaculaceae bacterium]